MKTICNYCGKEFTCDDYRVELCNSCQTKEFYTVENMIAYLDYYDLVDTYYTEMQASIYNKDALAEFVNDDRDHFIEWCINTFHQDRIDTLKSLGIIRV